MPRSHFSIKAHSFCHGYSETTYLRTALVLQVHQCRAPGAGREDNLVGKVFSAVLRLDADTSASVIPEKGPLEGSSTTPTSSISNVRQFGKTGQLFVLPANPELNATFFQHFSDCVDCFARSQPSSIAVKDAFPSLRLTDSQYCLPEAA